MLSKEQFGLFDKDDYYDDTKMNYEQFRDHADYFHGTHHDGRNVSPENPLWRPDWQTAPDSESERYNDSRYTHAGTERAALDIVAGKPHRPAYLIPLRHTGEYNGWTIGDQVSNWGPVVEKYGHTKTLKYENGAEDPGSISVVGPARNFQSYTQYVEDIPEDRRTPYQSEALKYHRRTGLGDAELLRGPEVTYVPSRFAGQVRPVPEQLKWDVGYAVNTMTPSVIK